MDIFYNSVINTIDKIDKDEEYLTFFTMCIDNLSLGEFSSILSGDIFYAYEENEEKYDSDNCKLNIDNNHLDEIILMNNEDINILKNNKDDINDIEIIEYLDVNDYLKNKLNGDKQNIQYLDKPTIIHNLTSLSKLENNQKLWLYQNVKKMDISEGYYIFNWVFGQSELNIIPCIVLTVQSALHDQMITDNEIKKSLYEAINGLDKLIMIYSDNEDLINLRILIKSSV